MKERSQAGGIARIYRFPAEKIGSAIAGTSRNFDVAVNGSKDFSVIVWNSSLQLMYRFQLHFESL